MPDEDWGIENPLNALAQAGKKAFLERPDEVRAALDGRSLEDACRVLGHPTDTDEARFALELTRKLDDVEEQMIKDRVLDALDKGEPFPFACGLGDDLSRIPRVSAREEDRDGKAVVVITATSPGDD